MVKAVEVEGEDYPEERKLYKLLIRCLGDLLNDIPLANASE